MKGLEETAASHEGIFIGYSTAYFKLRGEGILQLVACSKTFELIIPWFDRWRNEIPGTEVN